MKIYNLFFEYSVECLFTNKGTCYPYYVQLMETDRYLTFMFYPLIKVDEQHFLFEARPALGEFKLEQAEKILDSIKPEYAKLDYTFDFDFYKENKNLTFSHDSMCLKHSSYFCLLEKAKMFCEDWIRENYKEHKVMQYKVNFEQEICCDWCNEVVHVHFEEACPVCGASNAGTDIYGTSLYEFMTEKEEERIFECEECGTKFKLITWDYCEEPEGLIEVVKEKELEPKP